MELHDDVQLLKALRTARPAANAAEVSAQRVSFVVSSLDQNTSVTREQIVRELGRKDAAAAP